MSNELSNVKLDVTFTPASTRTNISSGENIATSFGKISKWLNDLGTAAFANTESEVTNSSNLPTGSAIRSYVTGKLAELGNILTFKGVVATVDDLPSTGNEIGDVYFVGSNTTTSASDFTEYVWANVAPSGSTPVYDWEFLGSADTSVDLSDYLTSIGFSNTSTNDAVKLKVTQTKNNGTATDVAEVTLPTATTSAYGVTKLSSSTSSTSTTLAATASAVKSAYDLADGKIGTVSSTAPIKTTTTGTGVTIAHNTSGVTANSYGPTADVTGDDGTTIKVPQITVNAYGHVTGVTERTYTSKNTANTDTKVTQNVSATSIVTKYPLLISAYEKDSTTTTATSVSRIQNIYAQPSTGTLYATKFNGDGSALTNVPHPTIPLDANTGEVVTLRYGDTFTAINSVTQDTNGHITKWNIANYTLPAAPTATDTKVLQSSSVTSSYRPLVLGYTSASDPSDLDETATQQVYVNDGLYVQPNTATLYTKGVWVNGTNATRTGLTNTSLRMNVNYTGSSGATFNNTVDVVRTYHGKISDTNSALVTVGGNGLTIVGSGESPTNLADLIDDDQTTANPNKLLVGPNGSFTTTVNGSTEHLLLSSDINIYFLTNCNTIADRAAVALTTTKQFIPDETGTGSIGRVNNHWGAAYIDTINGDLEGNVQHTITNPTSSTIYGITFHASPNASNSPKVLRTSDGVRYQALEGTSSALGHGVLIAGNNVASGTAGNKYGVVRLYGESTTYCQLAARGTGIDSIRFSQSASATGANLSPGTTNIYDLGTSSLKWRNVYATTFTGDVTGNVTGNVTGDVQHTATNPTSSTTYGITFHSTANSSAQKTLRTTDGLRYASLEGTTSAAGYGIIIAGNNVASGTAGNKYGKVRLYAQSTYYGEMTLASSITANRTYTFPNKTGTVAMTSDLPTDSGQLTLTIPSNVNINTSSSKLYYRKYGPVVYVYGMLKMSAEVVGPSGTIATLPTGYRPPSYKVDTCIGYGSSDASANMVLFRITTDGNIILIPGSNGTFNGTGKLVSGSELTVHATFMAS